MSVITVHIEAENTNLGADPETVAQSAGAILFAFGVKLKSSRALRTELMETGKCRVLDANGNHVGWAEYAR